MTLSSQFVPALLFLSSLFLAQPVLGAPQALGILATVEPLPMMCDAASCRVELGTFCLQEARDAPAPGTRYRPSQGDEIVLLLTTADGSHRRILVGAQVTVRSARGFTAVNLTLPADTLARSGAVAAALEIGRRAALEPMPLTGDPTPQSPGELATATGVTRLLANRFLDDHASEGDAARLIERMINSLPEIGPLADETDGRVWRMAASGDPARLAGPEGVALARLLHDSCTSLVTIGQSPDMRQCLQGEADQLMVRGSVALWAATGGS